MVGGLGGWDCTCIFVLALECCVSDSLLCSSTLSLTGVGEKGHAATEDGKEIPAATGGEGEDLIASGDEAREGMRPLEQQNN